MLGKYNNLLAIWQGFFARDFSAGWVWPYIPALAPLRQPSAALWDLTISASLISLHYKFIVPQMENTYREPDL
jgi:hypothetical protein